MPTVSRKIPAVGSGDWEEIREAFARAPEWPLQQFWLATPQKEFRAGWVRLGWRGDRFLYFAEFQDDDVTTRARQCNQRLWELGDVCELFAGEVGRPAYLEYHTAPNNVVLQLQFPHANPFDSHAFEELVVKDDAAVQRALKVPVGWEIYGEIPGRSVTGREGSLRGQVWEVSVSRYDYDSRGNPPVLSSTSPHPKLDFHRRMDWRQIRFE